MKFKLDENIPVSLAEELNRLGHDTDTVGDEGLLGHPDDAVWMASQSEQRFLITQDLDFSDLRRFAPGTHWGLLLVRLREPGARALKSSILSAILNNPVETWSKRMEILTEHKIRIRNDP